MALRWCFLFALAFYARLIVANIDKKVFLGPPAVRIPAQHPTIHDLGLDVLRPGGPSLRTRLACSFTTNSSHKGRPSWEFDEDTGTSHWLLLDDLAPGQRYELRLCWSSSVRQRQTGRKKREKEEREREREREREKKHRQHDANHRPPRQQPSSFRLRYYDLPTVWDTPKHITSLSEYSHERHRAGWVPAAGSPERGDREASVLLLQIFAAADFFTTNKTLMKNPPPVAVDISLDPYMFNLVPHILIPVILYITVVVVISFLAGRGILSWLRTMAASPELKEKKAR